MSLGCHHVRQIVPEVTTLVRRLDWCGLVARRPGKLCSQKLIFLLLLLVHGNYSTLVCQTLQHWPTTVAPTNVTLTSKLGVTQGHWKWHRSTDHTLSEFFFILHCNYSCVLYRLQDKARYLCHLHNQPLGNTVFHIYLLLCLRNRARSLAYHVVSKESATTPLCTHSSSASQTDRQTDRRTDKRTDGKAILIVQHFLHNTW